MSCIFVDMCMSYHVICLCFIIFVAVVFVAVAVVCCFMRLVLVQREL